MKFLKACVAALLFANTLGAQTTDINITTNKIGAAVQPTMYGVFFEDINFAADGGLYAEKVKNRSFEFPQSLMGWKAFGKVEVRDDGPFDRAPHYVRLSPAGHRDKHTGLENEGFFGVAVKKGDEYRLSFWARTPQGGKAAIRAEIVDPQGHAADQIIATVQIDVDSPQWKMYEATFTATDNANGALRLFLCKPEVLVDLEHISLFPVNTWLMHKNGLRADVAQKIADLRPGVFRFPGGCIVEGTDLDTRYNWKNSVGPVENRPLNENRWQYTFPHKYYPDYYQSYGLGFFEFFEFCEEIMAEPLPVVSVGLACQFQNDLDAHVPVADLQPYIQDALDLVEFANGDTTTTWGRVRAQMGHPKPFNLKYIGLGNEQWGPEYVERLEPFVAAMRKAHPEIMIVGSAGPSPDGERFDYLWPEMRRIGVDLVDEHYYCPEDWFLKNVTRYDKYPRKGPKVFAGEYACHARNSEGNSLDAALMEAALMTGLERNADIVHMATYAPLLAHENGYQWKPDMIWYDNFNCYGTPNYYVQQLFSLNKGTNVMQLADNDGKPITGQNGLCASAVYDKATGEYVVKVVNTGDESQFVIINFKGMGKKEGINKAVIYTLDADSPKAVNTVQNPVRVVPRLDSVPVGNARSWTTLVPAKTLKVFRFSK